MAMGLVAGVYASPTGTPNGTWGVGNTRWTFPRMSRSGLAPRWTVNRLYATPKDGDLRYAACKLHPPGDLHYGIREQYIDGWFWAEQKYTAGAWEQPNAWIYASGLYDTVDINSNGGYDIGDYDTSYNVNTYNHKNMNERKCTFNQPAAPAPAVVHDKA